MPFKTELVGSTVEMLVMKLLAERAMYGYEIIQIVQERTEGAFTWKEGTLYPVLHRLEGRGLLTTEWRMGDTGKPRKYYLLTAKGRTQAHEKVAEWQTFTQAIQSVLCGPSTELAG